MVITQSFRRPAWPFGLCVCLCAMGAPSRADGGRRVDKQPDSSARRDETLGERLHGLIAAARGAVFPALVNIKVITVRYWGGREHKGQAVGSGTIISRDGHVLTNYHVAQNGKKFTCTLADKEEVEAELVGKDPLTDLAVLKLDLSTLKDPRTPLAVARFGDSDALEIGETVMAMGSPWALSQSVTLGIVSNTERVLGAEDDDLGEMYLDEHQRTGLFNRWIQHDAAISPGNSGGPLVNLNGNVVGVNTRGVFFGGDIGFAIPSNIASAVAHSLIERGEVPRSWWGLSVKPIKKTGLDEGVLINSVDEDGPADKAGLRAGDVILAIAGQAQTVRFPEQIPPLLKQLADYRIGSPVDVIYLRDDQRLEAQVTTEKLKKDRGEEAAFRAWGLVAVDITERMARERRLEDTKGVLIESVRAGNPAQLAEPPLTDGDVIRSIDGEAIDDLEDLAHRYEQIVSADQLPAYLLVEFDRKGKNHLTLLKPEPEEDVDPPREVAKAWVGVAVQPVVKKLAEQLGQPDSLGFRITRVYPGTRAAEIDLRVGDIILALNGERLRPRGMQDAGLFHRRVRRLDIDGRAALTVWRDDQAREVSVRLERTRITPAEARRDRNRDFELTVREMTFFDRDENRWQESIHGVIVERVEPAGWAELGGLRADDLIQRIDDLEIVSLSDYRGAMETVTEQQPNRVVFVVLRGPRTHFQYVEPDWRVAVDEAETAGQNEE